MAAIPLSAVPLSALKKELRRTDFPDVKSAHLSEAVAASLGFRSHAALLAALVGPEEDRDFRLLSTERMMKRLVELGYPSDDEFDFDLINPVAGIVKTMPLDGYGIKYRSLRSRAYRNVMLCAINAGLERALFTLRPGDDRFEDNFRQGHLFDFQLPNGLQARASVADAGCDELAIRVAVNPKGDAVRDYRAGFRAGDAHAHAWLERQRGAWMQTCMDTWRCRRHLLASLAAIEVEPKGYGDRGRVIM